MVTTAVQSNNKRMPCSIQAYTDRFLMSSSTGNVKWVIAQSKVKKWHFRSLGLCVITQIIFVLKSIKIAS